MTSRNALHQELKRNIESERNSVHRSGYEDGTFEEVHMCTMHANDCGADFEKEKFS